MSNGGLMTVFADNRRTHGYSQRAAASKAKISFRTYQLLEKGGHDAQVSTWQKLAKLFGIPATAVLAGLEKPFREPVDSVYRASLLMVQKPAQWTYALFDFVDAFRRTRNFALLATPPESELETRLQVLLAAVVEQLSQESGLTPPLWLDATPVLPEPWFVAGIENLKAMALIESPLAFRKRGIFVLSNFLDRA
jgi:DNA-binding XRE family transcriptional regulator